jgi:hypothetical protein
MRRTVQVSERFQPGDAVLVDSRQALRLRLPGPPVPALVDGTPWLPGIVQRVRDDGWLVVLLAATTVLNEAARQVVAPPEAVRSS